MKKSGPIRLPTTKRSEHRTRYFIREKAQKRGWNVTHVANGGNFLEENEIVNHYPDIGLGQDRPDFLIALNGIPVAVVEAKNEAGKLELAIQEAQEYADRINDHGKYQVHIAIGAAGEDHAGFEVAVFFKGIEKRWRPLKSHGEELTAIPSPSEVQQALHAMDCTTTVTVPDQSEFIDAAIELSKVLRSAKIEAPLRPKVIGSLVTAMYQGKINTNNNRSLASVNSLLKNAINTAADLQRKKQKQLVDALTLSGADFNRLGQSIGRISTILNRLNVKAVLRTDTDFLGMFYEAFLRYGYDNNALGIVFTPRHITRYCVRLTGIEPTHKVIDIASGTGGFLVAAYDAMNRKAQSDAQRESIRNSLTGFDTNPTIWALASLNMFFRGDGKSHIENSDCFQKANKESVAKGYDRAYLNPPFSQDSEPEYMFIDAAMDALKPTGIISAVVLAGVFADDKHRAWRQRFLKKHRLLAIISLPEDLFYPTAAPTSIIVAQAHVPHKASKVFMARVWNDGYAKLKGRRVPCEGEQLSDVENCFNKFWLNETFQSPLAVTILGRQLSKGEDWSPQQWLPQPTTSSPGENSAQSEVALSIFRAVTHFPELTTKTLPDFGTAWKQKPPLPLNATKPLSHFFEIRNGKSVGEGNFPEGDVPYISSGDTQNSIVRLIDPVNDTELFPDGAITVTAFGQAYVQPWPFLARGNGGSSVRVLTPRFAMSVRDLVWFAAQINMQRWRFFYARQAILGRLRSEHFQVSSPRELLADGGSSLASKLLAFRQNLVEQSSL
ncbi:MAG: N-6 DNA methylase [Holophagales bacterium]|jgi:hypothetical protein|nr:N-6 DNA methylase [Holophagales bacterium]